MRAAYLDCSSGISGDMFGAALVDAGVPLELLQATVSSLHLDAELRISRVQRGGVAALKLDASIGGNVDHYAPGLSHVVGFAREAASASAGKSVAEIAARIDQAGISSAVKRTATTMFESLAQAEAVVHESDLATIRFHELAIEDVLVDILCAAVAIDSLGPIEWLCSPLNVGGGSVNTSQGRLSVPMPVVAELLRSIPYYSSSISAELVTPTGAAIIKTLAARFVEDPALRVERTACGAGARDFPTHANLVRLLIGERS